MSASAAVHLQGVGRRFGRRWILSSLDLTVQPGETLAIFGNNGTGKTTLLQILATLLSPTRGDITIFGHSLAREKNSIRRLTGYIGHAKQLYNHFTVDEYLELVFRLRHKTTEKMRTRVDQSLDTMGLTAHRQAIIETLSEGMKKRLTFCRLLLCDPRLILLDEPHPTLDAQGKMIFDRLMREWKQNGKTIFIASHEHDQTLAHADRVVIINEGKFTHEVRDRNKYVE
ncbi:MAG: heme ABC exporter ATP-binding protein CcmA [Deltaproteobacteria bacterium]|nr:heme ABC exporter ATP-binding protein CcmA [Deltaproteobacteria bacterium]